MTRDTLAIILGGGQGSRLFPLTATRSKPAVPIGGKYRLIDIPISGCLHADIRRIFVLTQFNSASLNRHISGTYRLDRFSGGFVEILAAVPVKAVDGGQIFSANCAACHQASGTGIPQVFPPLAGSEWVTGKEPVLIQILLHGVTGSIEVGGATYNGAMPAFGDKLDDAEIAAVLSYVRGAWGNQAGPVTPEAVQAQRGAVADRTTPWNGGADLAGLK